MTVCVEAKRSMDSTTPPEAQQNGSKPDQPCADSFAEGTAQLTLHHAVLLVVYTMRRLLFARHFSHIISEQGSLSSAAPASDGVIKLARSQIRPVKGDSQVKMCSHVRANFRPKWSMHSPTAPHLQQHCRLRPSHNQLAKLGL